MPHKTKLIVLAVLVIATIALYLGWNLGVAWQYALNLRLKTVAAIIVAGVAVGVSTLVFHTIVNNRVVTPQALGLDKLYELSKTAIIYFFGAGTLLSLNFVTDYLISLLLMVIFALLLYRFIFQKVAQQNIYFLLLVGLICSTLFDNMTTFFQVLLDPDEFQIAAYAGFASFNVVKMETVGLSLLTIVPILLYSLKHYHKLDVMALGRDHALNLGLDYDKTSRLLLILVVLALALSLIHI